jgi:hypothetical protein
VKGMSFLIGASQLGFAPGMHGAEHVIVDHDMVVTQVFRRLGKRLDRSGVAAKFDLRINHASLHRSLLCVMRSTCHGPDSLTGHGRPVWKINH